MHAFLVQESWVAGNKIITTRGHTLFYHGFSKSNCSRGKRGAAMSLPTMFYSLSEVAEGVSLVTSSENHNDAKGASHIEVNLKIRRLFKHRKGAFKKKKVKCKEEMMGLISTRACGSMDEKIESQEFIECRLRYMEKIHMHFLVKIMIPK